MDGFPEQGLKIFVGFYSSPPLLSLTATEEKSCKSELLFLCKMREEISLMWERNWYICEAMLMKTLD